MSEIEEHRPGQRPGEQPLDALADSGAQQMRDSAVEDVPGAPTWPIASADATDQVEAPPVGLSWTKIAQVLDADVRVLRHEGAIVLRGEYVPEAGTFIDAGTRYARRTQTGDRVFAHGYFISQLTMNEFQVRIPLEAGGHALPHTIVRPASAPVIGLFIGEQDAERARQLIVQGSLGAGVVLERGPLGVELRVARCAMPGRVATVVAGQRGAVISVGGESLT